MLEEKTKNKLALTEHVVKATHTEHYFLWCLHAKESPYEHTQKPSIPKANWKDESQGFILEIGELAGKPVCVSGFWAIVNCKRVLFLEMTSMYCDYSLMDSWIKENCPNVEEVTDAMNFGRGIL